MEEHRQLLQNRQQGGFRVNNHSLLHARCNKTLNNLVSRIIAALSQIGHSMSNDQIIECGNEGFIAL